MIIPINIKDCYEYWWLESFLNDALPTGRPQCTLIGWLMCCVGVTVCPFGRPSKGPGSCERVVQCDSGIWLFETSCSSHRSCWLRRESLKRSSEVARAVACMARKLCMECPDRADPRAAAVDTSMSLLKALGNADHVGEFARFLLQLSRNTKVRFLGLSCRNDVYSL